MEPFVLKTRKNEDNPFRKEFYEKRFETDDYFIPAIWERLTKIKIVDPDGWRQESRDFGEEINWEDWFNMMKTSTIGPLTCEFDR